MPKSNTLARIFRGSLDTLTGAHAARRAAVERENAARRDTLRQAAEQTRTFGGSMAELVETLSELGYTEHADSDVLASAVRGLGDAASALDKASNRV